MYVVVCCFLFRRELVIIVYYIDKTLNVIICLNVSIEVKVNEEVASVCSKLLNSELNLLIVVSIEYAVREPYVKIEDVSVELAIEELSVLVLVREIP